MLRKIFIGLLILSALTSEGIANLPDNFYKYILSWDSELSSSGDKESFSGQQQEKMGSDILPYNMSVCDAFILTASSVKKLQGKSIADGIIFVIKLLTICILSFAVLLQFLGTVQDSVLLRSDSSPPAAIL